MATKSLQVQKLTPTVGAEVLDVDVQRLRDDEDLASAVMDALELHGVLVFRELYVDDQTQVDFSRQLGDVVTFPANAIPEIFIVSLDPQKTEYADLLRANVGWHIDGTLDGVPAKASMLSAKVLSAEGGDTEFASTYSAYEDLSPEEQERLATLRVRHSLAAGQRDGHENPTPEQLEQWGKKWREHPLVWTHQTGRKSLVIGHNADYIVGMDVDEGRALIASLNARATRPERVYRHVWSEGDAVLWDNRGLMHRATPYDPSSQREMHRTTLAGDEAVQ
jgi:alpha-ketoglutarate-dependent taurine dioxygenase